MAGSRLVFEEGDLMFLNAPIVGISLHSVGWLVGYYSWDFCRLVIGEFVLICMFLAWVCVLFDSFWDKFDSLALLKFTETNLAFLRYIPRDLQLLKGPHDKWYSRRGSSFTMYSYIFAYIMPDYLLYCMRGNSYNSPLLMYK